jgi:acetyl-CoA synthetase
MWRYWLPLKFIWEKSKTIGGATSLTSLYSYGCSEHLSDKILSFFTLMEQASTDFKIPEKSWRCCFTPFYQWNYRNAKGVLHVHHAVLPITQQVNTYLIFMKEIGFWCTAPGWVTGTSYGIIAPLVSGVTSIIDEAEFDAIRWYSTRRAKVTTWYTEPTAIRR